MSTGVTTILRKIGYGLRTQGPRYLIATLDELAHSREQLTRFVRSKVAAVRDRLTQAPAVDEGAAAWSHDTLQFFYDLAAAPVTFDFASYLAGAEVERRLRGLSTINVVFVLEANGSARTERPGYDAASDIAARRAHLRSILIPMLAFLPSVRSFAVCATRGEAEALMGRDPAKIYPSNYRVSLPRQPSKDAIFDHARAGVPIWPMLTAADTGRRFVAEFLERETKGRKPVVITLRNCDPMQSRNSRNQDWLAFANALDLNVYAPIFVHDTETSMRDPPADFGGQIVCHAASWSLDIRMALYEAAWLNMALMHGPMGLCWYNERARYVLFIAPGLSLATTEAALGESGHRLWADHYFARPYQRMVWKRDQLPALQEAFAGMERVLLAEPRL